MTQVGGGSGPWVFLVDRDPPSSKTAQLRTILGLRREEDLWLEFAFYPTRAQMRNIIRRIWKQPQLTASAAVLGRFLSKRKTGYEATLAHGRLRAV